MKYLVFVLLVLPIGLGAQRCSSLSIFGAHGFSYAPNTLFTSFGVGDNYSPINVSRFGLGASIGLGKQTYLRTSVQFSQYGFRWDSELYLSPEPDGNGGFTPTSPLFFETHNRDHYLEAMVTGGYELRTRTAWKPFVELGVGIGNYLTSAWWGASDFPDFYPEGLQIERIEWYRSVSYLGRAGLGTNFALNDRFNLYGMAVFQQHLRTINTTGSAKIRPWQATLEVGVRMCMGKRDRPLKKT